MGDCSLTLAMDLSLAQNQKTPILSNQLVERGQIHTKQTQLQRKEKLQYEKRGNKAAHEGKKLLKVFYFFSSQSQCQTVGWN